MTDRRANAVPVQVGVAATSDRKANQLITQALVPSVVPPFAYAVHVQVLVPKIATAQMNASHVQVMTRHRDPVMTIDGTHLQRRLPDNTWELLWHTLSH